MPCKHFTHIHAVDQINNRNNINEKLIERQAIANTHLSIALAKLETVTCRLAPPGVFEGLTPALTTDSLINDVTEDGTARIIA